MFIIPTKNYEKAPQNFVVIDFETANKAPDSVCQIGIVQVENNTIVSEKSYLIRPPYRNFIFADIHGITFNDVKDAPTFADVWSEISPYIENQTIATYNLSFDWRCLSATLDYYQLPSPSFSAFDILANVKRELRCKNYQLSTVCQELNFEHTPHEALSDAIVTAKIQLYFAQNFPEMLVQMYISSFKIMLDKIASAKLSDEDVLNYGNGLLTDKETLDYEEYKKLFMIIEQIASIHSNPKLYQLCGLFYEKCHRLTRAIFLYQKALSLDETLRLKTRIQRLEKIVRQNHG